MASTILLVEDDFITQVATKHLLTKAGFVVDVAKNGGEAVALIKKSYQLILMDFGLPDISGFDLTKLIREQENPNQHVPIVGLTALDNDEYIKKAFSVGMSDVKIKPLTQQLWETIASSYFNREGFGDSRAV